MRIAIFCDLLPTLLNFRGRMVRRMSECCEQITVVAQDAEPELIGKLKDECGADFFPVTMNRTGINPIHDLSYKRTLKDFLADYKPQHTFAFQAKAAVYSSIAAKSFPDIKTTVLFPGLGYLFSETGSAKDKLIRFVGRCLYRYAFSKVNHFVFQNPDDIQTLKSARVISEKSHVTLVNGSGVPLDEYQVSEPVLSPVRFLFMGRLLWEKGVREFCEAARMIHDQYGDRARFQILGPLDSNPSAVSESDLNRLCEAAGIEYLGVTKDVRPFISQASVFVLPSYYMEGTPRSILESMSMSKAIITADSRGCREPVEQGVNGFLVEPRNVEQLRDAMKRFIDDPDLIVTMGQASRQIAEDKYDVFKVNQSIVEAMGLV